MESLKRVSVTLKIEERRDPAGELKIDVGVTCCNLNTDESAIDPIFLVEGMFGASMGIMANCSVHDTEETKTQMRRIITQALDDHLNDFDQLKDISVNGRFKQ